jgi:hypothetical protein
MQFVTNDEFGILLIPECKQHSISQMDLRVSNIYDPELTYIIPYRNPYDRIIRAIAADLHELMHDSGYADLNIEKWDDVRTKCLGYIDSWLETATLPIVKEYCHSAYFINYVSPIPKRYVLLDVDKFDLLPKYIKLHYGLDLGEIAELPPQFYEHTVPYWEIDRLYHSHKKMHTLIDEWCASDLKESSSLVIDHFFINS